MRTSLYLIALALLVAADPTLSFDGFAGCVIDAAFGAGAVFATTGDLAEHRALLRGQRP